MSSSAALPTVNFASLGEIGAKLGLVFEPVFHPPLKRFIHSGLEGPGLRLGP